MRKGNEGFTLLELLLVILIGALVTAAASTLLYLGTRISARSNKLAQEQQSTILLMEVIGNAASEEAYRIFHGDAWSVENEGQEQILSFSDGTVSLRGVALLEGVEESSVSAEDQLVTITMKVDGREYATSVYCRFLEEVVNPGEETPDEGEADLQSAFSQRKYEEVLNFVVESGENTPEVAEFIEILASQYGSRGQILDENGTGTGQYFSQWYIGGYEDHPDWNEETPWCACYLSWAMAQCDGLREVPRYANVDTFWMDLVTEGSWSLSGPMAGDIVFFDWIPDESYDPQHVGAVIAVTDGWIYTIEGNSGNRVAVNRYEPDDPSILGYGQLNWK